MYLSINVQYKSRFLFFLNSSIYLGYVLFIHFTHVFKNKRRLELFFVVVDVVAFNVHCTPNHNGLATHQLRNTALDYNR